MKNHSTLDVPTMANLFSQNKIPEILFWVGCSGSFDDRAKSITRSFIKILNHLKYNYAVLGVEESCTGDPAKRAGNEFLFQMQAFTNIELLNSYKIKKIVTTCPHCFNTFKNEYPQLGGDFSVMHHTQFIQYLIDTGELRVKGGSFRGKRITYHDPCYLGRSNNIYDAPRSLIKKLDIDLMEMNRNKDNSFCCGAGGAQLFKESEKGIKEINNERSEEALNLNPDIIAVGCPFCKSMLMDGTKSSDKNIDVLDISELIVKSENL
ncbi:MAG: CoB--CoM heterodisulfide reductase [Flavobacteriales bacterium]|nr:CoB--CoM heterodisulfide reductase [Flavobacteriales bacterium]|tara:strand:- start:471 stop:1262 length:792 start_codon:yes stop_codon:yes gene_type:complete